MISAPNRAAPATFSGLPDAWSTGLPLDFLQYLQLRKVARTRTADPRYTYLYIDLGDNSVAVQWLAVCGHNLTPGVGKVRWRKWSTINPAGLVAADFTRNAALPAGWAVTRADNANYFGADGLLHTAGVNVTRPHYEGGVLQGHLIEEASTNSIKWSRDLTSSSGQWTIFNCTVQKLAPGIDGVANAATQVTSVGSDATITQAVTAGQSAVLSAYIMHTGAGGSVQLSLDGFATWQTFVLTAGYQRFKVAGVTGTQVGIRFPNGGGLPNVNIDAVQLEVGRTDPTSPIHTTAAAATRAADTLTFAGVGALGATFNNGALLLEGKLLGRPAAAATLMTVGTTLAAADRVSVEMTTGGVVEAAYRNSSTGTNTVAGVSGAARSAGDIFTAAISWQGSTVVRGSFDGGAASSDVAVQKPNGAASNIVLGGGCYCVRTVRLYAPTMTATQLQSLSDPTELELAADFDTGDLDAFPAAWMSATTAEQRATLRNKHAGFMCPTEQTGGHWRLDLIEPTHPKGYLQLGRVFMGPVWQPPVNVAYGDISMKFVDRDLVSETASGAEYGVKQQSPREARVTWRLLDDEDLDALLYIDALVGTSEEVYWARDPDDEARLPLWSFIGRFLELTDTEEPDYGATAKTAVIRERL